MRTTEHQERSAEVFQNFGTQIELYDPCESIRVWKEVVRQQTGLCLYNIAQIISAHEDKDRGGEGLVHNVYFEN